MSILDFLKGGKNPADAAMDYYNQIPGMSQQYLDPYRQHGEEAYKNLSSYGQMASDPAAFLESLMQSYQPSRGYQLRRDEALKAAGNTAAAGGMRGSLQDISNESRIEDVLLGEDMQQWLANVLGIQKTGLGGEEDLYKIGYDAGKTLEEQLAQVLAQQGNLAYQGVNEQNQRQGDLFSSILKGIGGLAGLGMSGGGTLGGNLLGKFL